MTRILLIAVSVAIWGGTITPIEAACQHYSGSFQNTIISGTQVIEVEVTEGTPFSLRASGPPGQIYGYVMDVELNLLVAAANGEISGTAPAQLEATGFVPRTGHYAIYFYVFNENPAGVYTWELGVGDCSSPPPPALPEPQPDIVWAGMVSFLQESDAFAANPRLDIYGNCDDQACYGVAFIELNSLKPIPGGQFYDNNPFDNLHMLIYYLGQASDDPTVEVYQINSYIDEVLVDDRIMIFKDADGTFTILKRPLGEN